MALTRLPDRSADMAGRTLTQEGSTPKELLHVREDELDHDGLHTHLHEGRRPVEA